MSRALLASTASALLCGAVAWAQMEPRPEWTLAATGDSIITRDIRALDDPLFLRWVEVVRAADVAFTNLECQVFRMSEFKGWPAAQHGGGYERGEPEVALSLKWAGFDIVARANNHSGDYGIEGMLATNRTLDEIGLVHAGVDRDLGLASRPKYFETRKGRVAIVSFASTFPDGTRAGAARADASGRPGLNPLRLERTYELDSEGMAAIRRIAPAVGGRESPAKPGAPVEAFGQRFVAGERIRRVERPRDEDLERILRNVRSAARQADFVIVTTHSHERGPTPEAPPPWLEEVAHKVVDAGATTFIVHGPHILRGIEVYKGKPILYSLGDFIFQYETTSPQGQDIYDDFGVRSPTALEGDLYDATGQGDAYSLLPGNAHWWDGAVVLSRFRGHEVQSIVIHPVELGNIGPFISGDGRAQRGTPRIAVGERARSIIEQMAKGSRRYGVEIAFENGLGQWRAAP
ncbi:MAG TPA: CapA family protein [Vicinamibacteria bacterium]|jgi:poly-gamma-glutamate capsule biosynthesis protein CapA/YwtB (metallophosphatase superfamily)|nr:CapA family protein [Vicinamibacteria bacterium]